VAELNYLLGLDMVRAALCAAFVLASAFWVAFALKSKFARQLMTGTAQRPRKLHRKPIATLVHLGRPPFNRADNNGRCRARGRLLQRFVHSGVLTSVNVRRTRRV
jgi:hypothetical protein